MNQKEKIEKFFWQLWKTPDRRGVADWAKENIRLPHSSRSEDFDIAVSPWLAEPAACLTDRETRELTVVGAVQGAKTTLAEIAIPYWLINDPAPIMFNAQTDDDAKIWAQERMLPILSASPASSKFIQQNRLSRKELTSTIVRWSPAVYALFQGAHSKSNLQSKTIRYLINDEPWMYPHGNLVEAYNRVTSYWNSFILNISTGGEIGTELSDRWDLCNQHEFQLNCPFCKKYFTPKWSPPEGFLDDPNIKGGMRWDQTCKDPQTGRWDFAALESTVYYSCPECGGKIYDTPKNRRHLSSQGKYKAINEDTAPKSRKGFRFNALAVDWVPFSRMVEEWLVAVQANRLADDEPLKEFITKRLAEFWDSDSHRPIIRSVPTIKDLRLKEGMEEKTFRAMAVDVQYGHFWALVRDWHVEKGSILVDFEKVLTVEDLCEIQRKYKIDSHHVMVDVADDQTKGLRLCSKHGWIAVRGEDRRSFAHHKKTKKGTVKTIYRPYSPVKGMDPFYGTKEQGRKVVPLIHFSKSAIMDRLFNLKEGTDYRWRVPTETDDEYHRQLDSWIRTQHVVQKTMESQEVFKKIRKDDHLLMCECFQVLMASIRGIIGKESVEEE